MSTELSQSTMDQLSEMALRWHAAADKIQSSFGPPPYGADAGRTLDHLLNQRDKGGEAKGMHACADVLQVILGSQIAFERVIDFANLRRCKEQDDSGVTMYWDTETGSMVGNRDRAIGFAFSRLGYIG